MNLKYFFRLKSLFLLLVLLFNNKCFCQRIDTTGSISELKVWEMQQGVSASLNEQGRSIDYFCYVKTDKKWAAAQLEFILSIDTLGIKWYQRVYPIVMDSTGYYIHAKMPEKVFEKHAMITCWVEWWAYKRDFARRVGGTTPEIKLQIISNPTKANIYLIPHRIWLEKFEKKKDNLINVDLDHFIMDSGKTNFTIGIDETVYTIVFELNKKFLIRTHYTRPFALEPLQTCNVTF
jgi:hypothetical protein